MKRLTHAPHCLGVLTLVISAAAFPAWSQQNNTPPKPPMREYPPFISGPGDEDIQTQPAALSPDQTPLTGAQEFTLGSPEMRHSYWVPGFRFENLFQSIPQGTPGTENWISSSYFVGTLSLYASSRHSELDVNYSGGGSVTNSNALPSSYYHEIELSQKFSWSRWQLQFLDKLTYLPQTSFGFGGVSNLAVPGVGGSLGANFPGLQSTYVPNQSIFTAFGPRFDNAFVTQVEYSLAHRSSLTAIGSIGILRFTQGNAIDTDDAIFSLGYYYQLTGRDTFGALYRFMGYRFAGNPQALNDHVASLAYGRKVTGRAALQLFGGPDVPVFRHPVSTQTSRVNFSAGAIFTYGFTRSNLRLSYSRGLAGGSGVLVGASHDQIEARISTRLSQFWQANLGGGYARNGAIASATIPGRRSQSFNSVFASAGLNRELGRAASFFVNYTFGYQNLNQSTCFAGTCGSNYILHQALVGFEWRARPVAVR